MEQGTIEREIFIAATPEIVYDVLSNPEHVRHWWSEASYELTPGTPGGQITFGDGAKTAALTVVDASFPRTFAFRWTHPADTDPVEGNSLLVTFELTPSAGGTLVRFTETGFREQGWTAAQQQFVYEDHATGWDYYLPRIAPYVADLKVRP
jgi:uncharacterized protein YndB with AHSA1/START domain